MNSEQTAQMSVDEIGMAILNGEMSYEQLSQEQLLEWAAWEPPPIDLTKFHLGTEEHRQQFLYQYQWQGDEVLFPAVAHIWDSLNGQRDGHCILIGALSGTGGNGRTALRKTLQKFLAECLDTPSVMPRLVDFASMDEWNAAVHRGWNADEDHVRALCERYSAILDGREPEAREIGGGPDSNVLKGPWR